MHFCLHFFIDFFLQILLCSLLDIFLPKLCMCYIQGPRTRGVWRGRTPPRIRDLYSKNFFEDFFLFTWTPLNKNRSVAPGYILPTKNQVETFF